jgi:predicted RNA-binding Zn ribbon-like protein
MKSTIDSYGGAEFGREFLWLDLANSLEWNGFGKLTDHLQKPDWLGKFLKDRNLANAVPRPVPMGDVLELRALLRRLAVKIEQEHPLDARDLAALNSCLNVPVRVKLIQRQNGAREGSGGRAGSAVRAELVPLRSGWPWLLSRIAASFAEMLALGRPDRLKFCLNKGCNWLFYDHTKANTRRWCNDRTCGNRARVQRSRRRAKKAGRA